MNKLYDRIDWHNNTTPAINESNLNAMSKAIDDIDDRVIQISADIVDDIADIRQWHDDAYQYKEDANQSALDAQGYAHLADNSAEDSEAWAKGTRDGSDVPSTDPTYHNNSKYYAEQVEGSVSQCEEAVQDCEEIKEEIIEAIGVPIFTIDFSTGELIYTNDLYYSFSINTTTGNLEWEVVA